MILVRNSYNTFIFYWGFKNFRVGKIFSNSGRHNNLWKINHSTYLYLTSDTLWKQTVPLVYS